MNSLTFAGALLRMYRLEKSLYDRTLHPTRQQSEPARWLHGAAAAHNGKVFDSKKVTIQS